MDPRAKRVIATEINGGYVSRRREDCRNLSEVDNFLRSAKITLPDPIAPFCMPAAPARELATIIRECIAVNRSVSDEAIALECSDRLGMDISTSQVSRLRRNLGLNIKALREQDHSRWNMHLLLSEFRHPEVDQIRLSVRDVTETVTFYVRLGVRAVEHLSGEGGMSVGTYPVRIVPGGEAGGTQSFIVYLRNLELYRGFLRSDGLSFVDRNTPGRTDREVVVTDPDGNTVVFRTHQDFVSDPSPMFRRHVFSRP